MILAIGRHVNRLCSSSPNLRPSVHLDSGRADHRLVHDSIPAIDLLRLLAHDAHPHGSGHAVAIGAVYATLARLGDKGLARFRLDDPLPMPGGRARKCFRLTPAGTRALEASTAVLTRMMAGWRPERAG